MTEREKIALDRYKCGSNCAQAVIAAFADVLEMDETQARRLMEGFGGGFGGMQEVCGAFSAATAIIGYLNSDGSIEAKTKRDTYERVKRVADDFRDRYGSIICYEILRGNKPVHLKCSDKIVGAVDLVTKELGLEPE